MITALWYLVLTAMLAAYAVLDGFDLGVGALHLALARRPDEREAAIDAIGPVWNGNEVWLLAAGGAMVVAFPRLYAAAFSGFYLPLMIVLWLLILRGVAIELRHQVDHELWRQACDVDVLRVERPAGGHLRRGRRQRPARGSARWRRHIRRIVRAAPEPVCTALRCAEPLRPRAPRAAYLAMKTAAPRSSAPGVRRSRCSPARRRSWSPWPRRVSESSRPSRRTSPGGRRWPRFRRGPRRTRRDCGVRAEGRAAGDVSVECGAHRGNARPAAAGLYPRLLPGLPGSVLSALDIDNAAASPHGPGPRSPSASSAWHWSPSTR